jgi:hypothetical protein
MPVHAEFRAPKTIVLRYSGKVTLDEVLSIYRDILAGSWLSPGCGMLCFTDSITSVPPTGELISIVTALRQLVARGLRAFAVVSNEPLVVTTTRIFAAFVSVIDVKVKVFESEQGGEAWLGDLSRQ